MSVEKQEQTFHALERKLGVGEAVGLSLSIVGPSMAVAFNVSLTVRGAGRAAPLAFAIGTVALGIVALSFVSFSRRIAHAGSVYAYIGFTFGWRWGFLAGWTLLLTYLTYVSGVTALIGNFLSTAARNHGMGYRGLEFVASFVGLLIASFFAYRNVRVAGHLILLLEAMSVLAIIVLSVSVLAKVKRTVGLSAAPFFLTTELKQWSGIGYAIVFCVLSFAGFEGATTLGEETRNPRRNIPIAILGTCLLAGVFYIFVSYAQVVGFGLSTTNDLANASAALDDLANRYVSKNFATVIDIATAVSALSCTLGSLSAAARLLFALGRAGLGSRISEVHAIHGTPVIAVLVSTSVSASSLLLWAPAIGLANYAAYLMTIGTLALILVYFGVTAAELAHGWAARQAKQYFCGLAGIVLLLWPLFNSLYPAPPFPNNLWPYVVCIWLIAGAGVSWKLNKQRIKPEPSTDEIMEHEEI